MKLRNGFIANSSSSSFIVLTPKNYTIMINNINCTNKYGCEDEYNEEKYPILDNLKNKKQLIKQLNYRLESCIDNDYYYIDFDKDIKRIIETILYKYVEQLDKVMIQIDISDKMCIHKFYQQFYLKCNELIDFDDIIKKYINEDSFIERSFYNEYDRNKVIQICHDMKGYVIDLFIVYKTNLMFQLLSVPYEDETVTDTLIDNYDNNYYIVDYDG